uniref:Uncharacterized protein n=1 Tax=Tanacetum cinerariifolium TaxID=118510 RepID=A0A699I0N6_TANCI|nr:hypothetical protein [Tanacetum cinerariifolium]
MWARGRGRGTTASKRGKKTNSSSSSINRMMMSNDDDDYDGDDVPTRMNKSQLRVILPFIPLTALYAGCCSVPETHQSRISTLNRANKNVVSSKVTSQSSGSYLLLEVEMELQDALHDLARRKMLTLIDVSYAESYLSTSIRTSSIFLQQEDLRKRCAMIINAGNNAEVRRRREGSWGAGNISV